MKHNQYWKLSLAGEEKQFLPLNVITIGWKAF